MSTMSTGKAAAYLGVSVKTIQRWDREGTLKPEGRTATNRRVYTKPQLDAFVGRGLVRAPARVIAYCRVSTVAQRPELKNQRRVLEEFTAARGLANVEWVEEIGGSLNFTRKKFVAVMDAVERREVMALVVAHKDRLARFGFAWFERFCGAHGCQVLVLNNQSLSPEQEMVQDLKTIVHGFSARLYGLRTYRKKLDQALKEDVSR